MMQRMGYFRRVTYLVLMTLTLTGCWSLLGLDFGQEQVSGWASIKASYCIDNQWGPWKVLYYSRGFNTYVSSAEVGQLYGNYGDFKLLTDRDKPWGYYVFRVKIDNFKKPSKEEIKQHKKNNQWYVYSGTFEYSVCDAYPTARDAFSLGWLIGYFREIDNQTVVRRTAKATIKIAPYSKGECPQCYNIYFEGIGFAIDFGGKVWDW